MQFALYVLRKQRMLAASEVSSNKERGSRTSTFAGSQQPLLAS